MSSLQIHARARQAFADGKLRSIPYRKAQIAQLGYMIKDNEQRFLDAFMQDLGRPVLESKLSVYSTHSSYGNLTSSQV